MWVAEEERVNKRRGNRALQNSDKGWCGFSKDAVKAVLEEKTTPSAGPNVGIRSPFPSSCLTSTDYTHSLTFISIDECYFWAFALRRA